MALMWEHECLGVVFMCGINSDMKTYYIPTYASIPERDAAIRTICAAIMVMLARTQRPSS